MTLNQRELAALLQVTPQQVQNLATRGMPIDRTGRTPRYDAAACLAWYIQRKQDEVRRHVPTDTDTARARKLAAEARLAELRLRELEGSLVPVEHYRAIEDLRRQELRARVLAMPGRWAPRVGIPVARAQALLEEIANDLLESLRHSGEAVRDHFLAGEGAPQRQGQRRASAPPVHRKRRRGRG